MAQFASLTKLRMPLIHVVVRSKRHSSIAMLNGFWLERGFLAATGERFDHGDAATLRADAFNMAIEKVDFALDLMIADGWNTPKYIAEGLDWLSGCEIAI